MSENTNEPKAYTSDLRKLFDNQLKNKRRQPKKSIVTRLTNLQLLDETPVEIQTLTQRAQPQPQNSHLFQRYRKMFLPSRKEEMVQSLSEQKKMNQTSYEQTLQFLNIRGKKKKQQLSYDLDIELADHIKQLQEVQSRQQANKIQVIHGLKSSMILHNKESPMMRRHIQNQMTDSISQNQIKFFPDPNSQPSQSIIPVAKMSSFPTSLFKSDKQSISKSTDKTSIDQTFEQRIFKSPVINKKTHKKSKTDGGHLILQPTPQLSPSNSPTNNNKKLTILANLETIKKKLMEEASMCRSQDLSLSPNQTLKSSRSRQFNPTNAFSRKAAQQIFKNNQPLFFYYPEAWKLKNLLKL